MRALLALLAMTTGAAASGVEMNYENFYAEGGRAHIILRLESAEPVASAILECAFMDKDGRAIDTATIIASNIEPGIPAYPSGSSRQVNGIETASCRVTATR